MSTDPTTKFFGDAEAQIADIIEHIGSMWEPVTWSEIQGMHTLRRNDVPALLVDTLSTVGGIGFDLDTLPDAIEDAWVGAEWPSRSVNKELWVQLFDLTGFIIDQNPREKPTESLTLYRGALPEFQRGMSWTDNRQQAQWFADRPLHHGQGRVYTARVEPERLFAYFNEGRGESEWVIETDGLRIREVK